MTIAESWHDLEADLLGAEPDYDSEPPLELDRSTADRYLRRIARLDAQYAADKEVAEAQIEQVRAWLTARYETYNAQRGWLQGTLRRFHEALLSLDKRVKTIKLPAGELRMRAQQPAWEFDGEAFIPWAAQQAPQTLRTIPETKAVDVNAAKAYLTQTVEVDGDEIVERGITPDGVVPPGVTVRDVEDKFSIAFGEEDRRG